MKQKNSWIVIHHVEEGTLFWVVRDLVNKWWSSHISIDPNQDTFCTFLVPWRLEQSLSIEYPMAYLRSFRTVCFSWLSTALLLEQLLQRPVATTVTWKVVGIFEEWCSSILSCTVLCHMHPRLSHETFHKSISQRLAVLADSGVMGSDTAIGSPYKHHDILGFASLNLVGILDW